MSRTRLLTATAASVLTLMLSGTVAAEQQGQQTTQQQGQGVQQQAVDQQQVTNLIRIRERLLNRELKTIDGKDIGEIEEVVTDASGRIRYVVLSHGGFLDIGDELIPIPWHALQASTEDHWILPVTQEQLANVPAFNENEYGQLEDPQFDALIVAFYDTNLQDGGRQLQADVDLRTLDINNDGRVSKDELQRLMNVTQNVNQQFNQVDQDRSGAIESSEFAEFEEQLQQGGMMQQPGNQGQGGTSR